MFVRKKVNRSGTTSVVVIDRNDGKFRQARCFGTSSDPSEIERLCGQAANWIMRYGGQQLLDFDATEQARKDYRKLLSNVERTLQNVPRIILNRVYDAIGFNAVGDDILRHLAIRRTERPPSRRLSSACW